MYVQGIAGKGAPVLAFVRDTSVPPAHSDDPSSTGLSGITMIDVSSEIARGLFTDSEVRTEQLSIPTRVPLFTVSVCRWNTHRCILIVHVVFCLQYQSRLTSIDFVLMNPLSLLRRRGMPVDRFIRDDTVVRTVCSFRYRERF